MAQFNWIAVSPSGCPFCGTSVDERGFVDCIADTLVRNPYGEVTGVVDVFICAKCAEQIARLVGSMTQQESLELVQDNADLNNENEHLKDVISAHQERYDQLLNNLSSDLSEYIKEKKSARSNTSA